MLTPLSLTHAPETKVPVAEPAGQLRVCVLPLTVSAPAVFEDSDVDPAAAIWVTVRTLPEIVPVIGDWLRIGVSGALEPADIGSLEIVALALRT
jgi:hypothetical protein